MKSAMRAKGLAASQHHSNCCWRQLSEVDERIITDDAAVVSIIEKLIKQRNDSIEQFDKAGRTDLADKERAGEVVAGHLSAAATLGRRARRGGRYCSH